MRTLIYKRTHSGDPDPMTGVFGNRNCMGKVRRWKFDAVIGIGGIGREPELNRIARKLTWVGIGKHETDPDRPFETLHSPLVTFDHFLYYGEGGPLLEGIAPTLAKRMYDNNVRVVMDSLSSEERREVCKILQRAMNEPPSGRLAERDFEDTSAKCRPKSCRR
jgi:hypothetical protein